MVATINSTEDEIHSKTLKDFVCSHSFTGGLRQESIFFSAVNILFSITALFGNSLILAALYKESCLHPPSKLLYRCLATADLLLGLVSQPLYAAYWMSLAHEKWNLCRNLHDAFRVAGFALSLVSLFTSTAISVDRLLALLLRLRYRQIVTLRRTYIIMATFWILSGFTALWFILDLRIAFLLTHILTASSLLISIASNIKIFRALSHHRARVQGLQQSHSNVLNMVRFKRAVKGALWVQLALVVCSVPYSIMANIIKHGKSFSSHMIVIWGATVVLIFFKSTLNPFLHCWKIREVRQAVKQTIRQALCCPWS